MTCLKLDENIPSAVGRHLQETGWDVHSTGDEGLDGACDEDVIARCRVETRCLITRDVGFADIHSYPPNAYPGTIVLRPGQMDRESVLNLSKRTAEMLRVREPSGQLWIVNKTGARIRT